MEDRRFWQFLEEELLKFESVRSPTDRITYIIRLKPERVSCRSLGNPSYERLP